MSKFMKLGPKLLMVFLAVGIIPMGVVAYFSMSTGSESLSKQAFAQLESVRDIKRQAVSDYFQLVSDQLATFSKNKMIIEAVQEFRDRFETFRPENELSDEKISELRERVASYYQVEFERVYRESNMDSDPKVERVIRELDADSVALQYHYIKANEHPLGEKHRLDRANDNSRYSEVHEVYHPIIRDYLEKFGYYDIFLADPESGDIVYSVFKELDFSTSLIDGPFADTNFGEAFRRANASDTTSVFLVDYAQYWPSYEAPASFIAAPIFDGEEKVGVALFQMPIDRLNAIMTQRSGLGETGETYLVGPDFLMRSDSYLDPEHHSVVNSFRNPDLGKVETEASDAALNGETGTGIIIDYNGNPVLSAYTDLKVGDATWALLAEIDEAEAFAAIHELNWTILFVLLGALATIVVAAFWFARSLTRPIKTTVEVIKEIAAGDFTKEVAVRSRDEIGELANAVNTMVRDLRSVINTVIERAATLAASSEDMSSISQQLASGGEEMTAQATAVASATEQMSSNVTNMASSMEEMSTNISNISSGAEETSQNMNSVASAVEEMSAAINQIASNSQSAFDVSKRGAEMSSSASTTMNSLGVAAKEIGSVTEAIKRIADQTNLLALNATIEAASAGEAGKGFAVVANEIKELANQSAGAAGEIAEKIDGIQERTADAVNVIADVAKIIDTVNSSVNEITVAVAQQTSAANEISANVGQAATGSNNIAASIAEIAAGANEISRNVAEAASGTNTVASNINDVNNVVKDSGAGIQQISTSAGSIAQIAGELQEMMSRFKVA